MARGFCPSSFFLLLCEERIRMRLMSLDCHLRCHRISFSLLNAKRYLQRKEESGERRRAALIMFLGGRARFLSFCMLCALFGRKLAQGRFFFCRAGNETRNADRRQIQLSLCMCIYFSREWKLKTFEVASQLALRQSHFLSPFDRHSRSAAPSFFSRTDGKHCSWKLVCFLPVYGPVKKRRFWG